MPSASTGRAIAKWLGFALVAGGIVALPLSIWLAGYWTSLAVACVMVGCVALVFGLAKPIR